MICFVKEPLMIVSKISTRVERSRVSLVPHVISFSWVTYGPHDTVLPDGPRTRGLLKYPKIAVAEIGHLHGYAYRCQNTPFQFSA